MRKRGRLGATALIAILVVACGSVSGTPAGSTPPSPTASLGGGGRGGGSATPGSSSDTSSASPAASGPTPSLTELDPCALLTESDATTLIGQAVFHTQGGGAGTKGPCVYADGTHDSVAVAIRVSADEVDAGTLMAAQMNAMRAEGFKVTTVDLGNARINLAYEARHKASGLITDGIYVQEGSRTFYVTTLSESQDPSDDAFKHAAETAIGNL